MRKKLWHGVRWLGACVWNHTHIQYVRDARLHFYVSASASCSICTWLLTCTLSDYCSPQCRRRCNKGSREDCAGGRGCPLHLLERKLLSALRRNKSFIWFVVFLTKGSWSRNKVLLSFGSAPILSLLLSHISLHCHASRDTITFRLASSRSSLRNRLIEVFFYQSEWLLILLAGPTNIKSKLCSVSYKNNLFQSLCHYISAETPPCAHNFSYFLRCVWDVSGCQPFCSGCLAPSASVQGVRSGSKKSLLLAFNGRIERLKITFDFSVSLLCSR